MSDSDQAYFDARNAAMRHQVDSLLEQFTATTEQLRKAQEAAATVTVTVTSPDELVTVTVDSSGSAVDLRFAPQAFDRSDPAALARSALHVLRRAGARARNEVAGLMAPLGAELPDLADLVPGAPSLRSLLPEMAVLDEPEEPEAEISPFRSEHHPRRDDSDEDDEDRSIYGDDR